MIYAVSGLCEEAEALTQTPLRHEENMQTIQEGLSQLVDLNPGHFCCDVTVLSTAAPCCQATTAGGCRKPKTSANSTKVGIPDIWFCTCCSICSVWVGYVFPTTVLLISISFNASLLWM